MTTTSARPERPDVSVVVWAPHEARSAAFARWLDAPLHTVHYLAARRPAVAPLKYVLQWAKTYLVLARERPRTVYVTNSPPFAGLCVWSYCVATGTRLVVDTHPPSLYGRKWRWARPIQRFVTRRADLNVIDQQRFADLLASWGARVVVLTNPPTIVPESARAAPAADDPPTFTYVGTFGSDEPLEILLDAARRMPEARFFVLGDTALAKRSYLEGAPDNVTFTGYVTGDAYWRRLTSSHGIVVLTTHEHSLLGAAQDARSAGVPLVVSDQPTLREAFTAGTTFVPNTPDGMLEGLQRVVREGDALRREMVELQGRYVEAWQRAFATLTSEIRRGPTDVA